MDVVLVKREGRLSGEAFVLLPGMMQVEFALGKHKAYLGKRYVEVQQAYKEVCLPGCCPVHFWIHFSPALQGDISQVQRVTSLVALCPVA